MGITYNKKLQTKDRSVVPTGPRDRQLKQAQALSGQDSLIKELRSQIETLTHKLGSKKSIEGYTEDQVNEEIAKAIKVETASLREKHKSSKNEFSLRLSFLEEKVVSLTEVVKRKDLEIDRLREEGRVNERQIIEALTEKMDKLNISIGDVTVKQDKDAPVMEDVFVDPIEKEDKKVERHIEVVSEKGKEKMDEKTKKLKNILGSLPVKG